MSGKQFTAIMLAAVLTVQPSLLASASSMEPSSEEQIQAVETIVEAGVESENEMESVIDNVLETESVAEDVLEEEKVTEEAETVILETEKEAKEIETAVHEAEGELIENEQVEFYSDVLNSSDDETVTLVEDGYCGDDASYELFSNGLLVITGSGEIDDDAFYCYSDVTNVEISGNITGIGN